MRENRPSGSEGGGTKPIALPTPIVEPSRVERSETPGTADRKSAARASGRQPKVT